uniref:Selenide, water dikinase n=1 Tax=Capra hircus TaxID=9925 RepID=A0A452EYZ1_CAPHI
PVRAGPSLPFPILSTGMDSGIIPLRHRGPVPGADHRPLLPLVMGPITCTNVLGDRYAVRITDCDNMLMLLSVSQTPQLSGCCRGRRDCSGRWANGGIIGGVATVVCQPNEFVLPDSGATGDVLVLTKPLGTQVAHQCAPMIKMVFSREEVELGHQEATFNMATLNRIAAGLMPTNEVSFVICNLPIIAKMAAISQATRYSGFLQGTSAEISGGLLICLPREQAAHFCSEIKSSKYGEGRQAQIVSIVEKGNQTARIIDKPRVIEVLPCGTTATALAPENSSASSEPGL